jgi:hypothetical protein
LVIQLKAFALLLAIVIADRVTGKNPDRPGVYVLAAVISAVIVVPMTVVVVASLIHFVVRVPLHPPGGIGWVLNIFFELLMVAGATIGSSTIGGAHAGHAPGASRGARADSRREAKHRIRPSGHAGADRTQFLFNTLAQVKLLYARDHEGGEQLSMR